MGDTQKSQTISTDNQKIARQVALDHRSNTKRHVKDTSVVFEVESSLVRIAMLAKSDPERVFTSLAHRIDISL
jgi:hypothetical protein